MGTMESDTEASSEEVYLDAARHFLDVQISTLDVLDTITSQSFSVGSIVLPVTFALLNLGAADIPTVAKAALGLALICYVALLVFAFLASLVRGLEYRPHIPTLKQHSQVYRGEVLKRWVADEHERSCVANEEILIKKTRWVGVATIALYLEALSLAIAAIAHCYCDRTSFGGGRGFGVRTMMFEGPGGGVVSGAGFGWGLVV